MAVARRVCGRVALGKHQAPRASTTVRVASENLGLAFIFASQSLGIYPLSYRYLFIFVVKAIVFDSRSVNGSTQLSGPDRVQVQVDQGPPFQLWRLACLYL